MAIPVSNAVALSGNPYVDGLVQGSAWQFSAGSNVITYAMTLNDTPGSSVASDVIWRDAFFAWAAVANITFSPSHFQTVFSESTADIAITAVPNEELGGAIALGIFPSSAFADAFLAETAYTRADYPRPEGDIFFAPEHPGFGYPARLAIAMHEIGHALGLKHTYDDGANGRPRFQQLGLQAYENDRYTVMSLGSTADPITVPAVTPMPLDILAIQRIYGANMSYHTGQDIYSTRHPDGARKRTIWDAGGSDTISAGPTALPVHIDLRPGSIMQFADGNVLAIAYNTIIENAQGGLGDDILIGNDADNTFWGDGGSDRMEGGNGDDTYHVSATTTIVELPGQGLDTVYSSQSYTLPANVETLILQFALTTGTGNELDNTLIGTVNTNTLHGLGGDDVIDGGGGAGDMLYGGAGNDTYLFLLHPINGVGTIVELPDEGIDTVRSNYSYVLPDHVENLQLIGAGPLNGNGNRLDNVITGNVENNTLAGGAGADTLFGEDGNDILYGDVETNLSGGTGGSGITLSGSLNDTLYGGRGNDRLDGGLGDDTMYGGPGHDTYYVNSPGDIIVEAPGEGIDAVESVSSYVLPENVEGLSLWGIAPLAGTGNDLDNALIGNSGRNVLSGRGGNDYIHGHGDDDKLEGGPGSDTLMGGEGNDCFFLQSVSDFGAGEVIDGGPGMNALHYTGDSAASLVLTANVTNIQTIRIVNELGDWAGTTAIDIDASALTTHGLLMVGNSGPNRLSGTHQSDSLIGGRGNDILVGAAGADALDGGDGDDMLYGGAGDDTIYAGAGFDQVFGEDGTDTLDFSRAGFSVATMLSIYTAWNAHTDAPVAHLWGIENIAGSAYGDYIVGNAAANRISGGGGNDWLLGEAGNDTLIGGPGNDALDGGAGDDNVYGGDGDDTIYAGAGFDRVFGEEGTNTLDFSRAEFAVACMFTTHIAWNALTDEVVAHLWGFANLTGSDYADYLVGDAGANRILGGAGNDWIVAGAGNDVVEGGAGNDTLLGEAGNDTLLGDAGNDSLDGGEGDDNVYGGDGDDTIYAGAGFDRVFGEDGTDTLDFSRAGFSVATMLGIYTAWNAHTDAPVAHLWGIENIAGSAYGDYIVGNATANRISGGGGNDWLLGEAGNDTLIGGPGNDALDGGAGDDNVYGGDGDDTIYAGAGFDKVFGEEGTNTLDFSRAEFAVACMFTTHIAWNALTDEVVAHLWGFANLTGSAYADYLVGDAGANRILGGAGNDWIVAGAGNDVVEGGAGNDTLLGGAGNDTLHGGTGNDTLDGGEGNNDLYGGDGDDTIYAGAGFDRVFGEGGTDTLDFSRADFAVASMLTTHIAWNALTDAPVAHLWGIENLVGSPYADYLVGDAGANRISGGAGNDWIVAGGGADVLTGGAGADVFDYNAITEGLDTITDFTSGAGGDKLDIKDVLVGYNPGTSDINDFVRLTGGASTTVSANADGAGTDFVALATLQNVAMTGSLLNDMLANGNLVVA